MCCLSYTTWAQTQSNVNGLVTDFSGEPLIGVSILVKGTSNGTVTDLDKEQLLKFVELVHFQKLEQIHWF